MSARTFEAWLESLADRTVRGGALERISEIDGAEIWMRRFWDTPQGADPLLTIKRIPAWTMLSNGMQRGLINRRTRLIVTASSGNFLYELAIVSREIAKETGLDLRVLGFVPRRIPQTNLQLIRSLGADVIRVETEQDLCPREATVMAERRFAATRRDVYNADQYISHENPLAHQLLTARTIEQETRSRGLEIDKILVPTGTGGTMSGLSSFYQLLRSIGKGHVPQIVGVEPPVKHHILGVHHITIRRGCHWNPETYTALFRNKILTVDDVDAYAGMLQLQGRGIPAGPSTGLVFHEAQREAEKGRTVLITSADNDLKYHDWTLGILKGRIGDEIRSRYPDMEELVAKHIDLLAKNQRDRDVFERMERIYKSEGDGRVVSYEEFLAGNVSFP